MILKKLNDVYLIVQCDRGEAQELSDYFTFDVPNAKFTPAFRNRFWDGKIRLFDIRTKKLYYGLIEYVQKFCSDRGYNVQFDKSCTVGDSDFGIIDCTRFSESLNLSLVPRDYQLTAVTHCINRDRTLLISPTASGKSLIIYLLLRYYNVRSLVVVPTVSLTQQMSVSYTHLRAHET